MNADSRGLSRRVWDLFLDPERVGCGQKPARRCNSRRWPPTRITAESALISSHLISTFAPPGVLTSASSPGSKVRPLIMAVRLGGLVMPLSMSPVVSTTVSLGLDCVTTGVVWGKNGLRPSFGFDGTIKIDCGMLTCASPPEPFPCAGGDCGLAAQVKEIGDSQITARPSPKVRRSFR